MIRDDPEWFGMLKTFAVREASRSKSDALQPRTEMFFLERFKNLFSIVWFHLVAIFEKTDQHLTGTRYQYMRQAAWRAARGAPKSIRTVRNYSRLFGMKPILSCWTNSHVCIFEASGKRFWLHENDAKSDIRSHFKTVWNSIGVIRKPSKKML